ncbi:BatA domain-containing protein [Mucilaginibacter myungsuensis]|uniref:BatA domain-containing protein n=1 Tax=Mucilaginibacter myungsuensis TaxID=649104 RepID=A0A929KXM5_9SPHI|nr:BatA domain-containing protein [Mucilaginibacter myungsuensis]MBE9662537.1 BatA domain-containing protein [Mucilaginibacter myungsuensis]MDN3597956.1 BatA domain-containing protein [Mucilaginibacter myungsuensis]
MLLASPLWLFALAAIGIPVVIHLWNIRPGRTLKVGSISLFKESSPKSSRSFKLTDILLLALRCFLLALIVLLFTGPVWKQRSEAGIIKGLILIPGANLTETYRTFQPKIDSLIKAGYEPRYFRADLKMIDLQKDLKTGGTGWTDDMNYWTVLKQVQFKVNRTLRLQIFTPNAISHFEGERPTTSHYINWNSYTPIYRNEHGAAPPDAAAWIAGAWLTQAGDIRLIKGTANSTGTAFEYDNAAIGAVSTKYITGVGAPGEPYISLKSDPEVEITVDTAYKYVAIYADDKQDANYLRSALQAVAQLTQQKTMIRMYDRPQAIPPEQDWLFWLSDKPIGADNRQHKNVFKYDTGKILVDESRLSDHNSGLAPQGETTIRLHRRIASSLKGEPIWTDSYGNAILTKEMGTTNVYHFRSRFNPQWSDLVWSEEFPKWIMGLTDNIKTKASTHERRALAEAQIQPIFTNNAPKAGGPNTADSPLNNYLWVALAITFMAERWLSTRNNRIPTND